MSFIASSSSSTSNHAVARGPGGLLGLLRLSFAVSVALLGTACGGGGDDATALDATAARTVTNATGAPQLVTLQGCVLDRYYIPTTGTPVRALAADGRLLGSAQSDGQGHFSLRLPARSQVTLQVDRPDGEALSTAVGPAPTASAPCLLDEKA